METVIYMLIIVFVLYLFSVQINKYNEVVFDKFRFRYFALRDRLAMLVVNGNLDEGSWEYKQLVDAINFHINATETMSIKKIARILAEYHSSSDEERKVRLLKKKVTDKAVISVVLDLMDVTYKLLERNSFMQLRYFRYLRSKNSSSNQIDRLSGTRLTAIDKIKDHKELMAA